MLLYCDSFDHYATADIAARWIVDGAFGSGATIDAAAARTGLNGLRHPNRISRAADATGTVFLAGFAIRWDTWDSLKAVIAVMDGSTPQVTIRANADGTLSACAGDVFGTVLATTTWAAVVGAWYHLEVKVVLDEKLGSVEIAVNGSLFVQTILSIANVDTIPSAVPQWNRYYFENEAADYDDLFICDGSGPYNNDFLGDCVVDALIAKSDTGDEGPGENAGLTPSTGTDHGVLVSNLTPNGDTDYNAGTTPEVKDTYQLPVPTSAGWIVGVQVELYAKKMDHVTKTVAAVVRTYGVDFDGSGDLMTLASLHPTVTYGYLIDVFEINPYTQVPWIGGEMKELQAGMKIIT